MVPILNDRVKTFSIGFDHTEYNEVKYAREISKTYNTEHYELIINSDSISCLPILIKNVGEPFADTSIIDSHFVSMLARQHVKMAISRDGGDEFFMGYNRFKDWEKLLQNIPNWYRNLSFLRKFFQVFLHYFNPHRWKVYPQKPSLELYLTLMRYFDGSIRKNIWKPPFHSFIGREIDDWIDVFENKTTSNQDYQSQARLMYIQSYLPNNILPKMDIAGITNSLEVRTPLVDI
jgi:asparagine synthase (glutamine-hydrolysing)